MPRSSQGLATSDVLGAVFCAEDGVADPPAVTAELVRRAAELGSTCASTPRPRSCSTGPTRVVIACGPWSATLGGARRGGASRCDRSAASCSRPGRCRRCPARLPMVVEAETGFHFRRRGDRLVLAMSDAAPRWGFETAVDESVFDDRLERLATRFPPAAGHDDRRRVGRPLRHDPGRPPDPRSRRRRASTLPAASRATGSCSRRPSARRSPRRSSTAPRDSTSAPYSLDRFAEQAEFPGDVDPLTEARVDTLTARSA